MNELVKLYTLSSCSHCKGVKKLLEDHGVDYEFVDVDRLEGEERASAIEKVKKRNPRVSFPTMIIGEKVVVGFKEKEIKGALSLEGS
jgi:glutaredoxin